jgi:ribonuclease HII
MICGVDEAGRGPVIGPLVIVGIKISDDEKLRDLNVRDSKKCTPNRRERLAKQIMEIVDDYETLILQPSEIDELRKRMTLNQIELVCFSKVMTRLRSDIYYVDSVDVNEIRFGEELRKRLPFKAEVISKHNADDIYPIVSAASILAKVRRDKEIRKIASELESKLGLPLGSGYPADTVTQLFIKEWIKKFGSPPPYIRYSWKTTKRLIKNISSKKLDNH